MARAEAGWRRQNAGGWLIGLGVATVVVVAGLATIGCAFDQWSTGGKGTPTSCKVAGMSAATGVVSIGGGFWLRSNGGDDRRAAELDWAATHGGGGLQLAEPERRR